MDWSRLDLGVGIVAVPGIDSIWSDIVDLVEVVEVEPQTFWERRGGGGWQLSEPSYEWLDGLRRPVVCHGVGYPVGGSVRPDPDGVDLTAVSARRLRARQWSEHLSFNRAERDGCQLEACFFLPPVQTWATVEAAIAGIDDYQARLDVPFLVETPANYLRPTPGELDDGRFVAEVATRADCGILLDLHNVWTNERNGRQSVRDFVGRLPLERVLEVHLAGGSIEAGYYLDAHDGPVADDLLARAAEVLPMLPNIRAVIFEATPEAVARIGADGVRRVLQNLHRLVEPVRSAPVPARHPWERRSRPSRRLRSADRSLSAGREHALAAFTTRKTPDWVDDDPGAFLLRDLTDHARLSMITLSRPDLVRRLVATQGRDGALTTAEAYLRECPAGLLTGDEGAQFAAWWQPEGDRRSG
jgi:uncharacterized protein (UPF0276 family)